MAKFLFASYRHEKKDHRRFFLATELYSSALASIGVVNHDQISADQNDNYLHIFNPSPSILNHECNLITNIYSTPKQKWWTEPQLPSEAAFKITCLGNDTFFSSDMCASRKVWYYYNNQDDVFLISDSQRAIVMFLGTFELNSQALSWFVSAGNIGSNSWDKRIEPVLPGTDYVFNKIDWTLKKRIRHLRFNSGGQTKKELAHDMYHNIKSTIKDYGIDSSKWITSLSGGLDSRALLYFFCREGKVTNTFSWGVESSLRKHGTDTYIAKRTADFFKSNHSFVSLEYDVQHFDRIISQYIHSGEGRIDHINSFTDSLSAWQGFYAQKYLGIIRADEAFGWLPVSNELDTRISLEFNHLSDYKNFPSIEYFDLPPTNIPKHLLRRQDETLFDYRDRLYFTFRIPNVINGLHDVVYPFLEVLNPFLSASILNRNLVIPSSLRNDKKLFRLAMKNKLGNVPFATIPSIPEPTEIASSKLLKPYILDKLYSTTCKNSFSKKLIDETAQKLSWHHGKYRLDNPSKITLLNFIPFRVKKLIRNNLLGYYLHPNRLALRIILANESLAMYGNDAIQGQKLT